MHVIGKVEKKKRGCQYCLHVTTNELKGDVRVACPFYKCPYTVLEKYKSYEEFMQSDDSKILVTEFFKTISSMYELASFRSFDRVFSDGDHKVDI